MRIIKSILFFFIGYIISLVVPINYTFLECIIFGGIFVVLYNLFRENRFVKFFTDIMVILLSSFIILKVTPIPNLCNNNIFVLLFTYILLVCFGLKLLKISFPKYRFSYTKTKTQKDISDPQTYNHGNLYLIIIKNRLANGFYPGMGGTTWIENYYIYSPTIDVYIHVNGTLEVNSNAKIVQAPNIMFLSAYNNSTLDEVIFTGDNEAYKNKLSQLASKYQYKQLYVTSDIKYVIEYKSQFAYNKYSTEKNENTDDNSMLLSLFSGCKDAISLKKRYLQLLKVYHPDNTNGDAEMTLKIQNTYNILKSQL